MVRLKERRDDGFNLLPDKRLLPTIKELEDFAEVTARFSYDQARPLRSYREVPLLISLRSCDGS